MPVSDLLRVTAEPAEHSRLIRADGEIDLSTVAALRRELDTAREEGVPVTLDLSGITFIDSTGLALLLEASRSSATSDWAFFVVRCSPAVERLIEVSGAADLLMLADPRRAATAALGPFS
jgi:anti-sigma B factor antagonist